MVEQKTIEGFLEVLSSKEPVPGGGGASALAGALGNALGQMVANLTIGKKKYADVEAEIKELLGRMQKLQAASCDAVGFGKIRIRAFPDIPAWERLNWPAQYETLPVRVTADVKILQ